MDTPWLKTWNSHPRHTEPVPAAQVVRVGHLAVKHPEAAAQRPKAVLGWPDLSDNTLDSTELH